MSTPHKLFELFSNVSFVEKSSNNLCGVDITKPDQLNIEYLAPGGDAGRLTVFTKSALQQLGGGK